MGVNVRPDILAVLNHNGIELKQRGRDLWGLCPFHDDRSPSFKVNVERQRWHCFGCNEGGDVIDFITNRHGLKFRDALVHLGIRPGNTASINQVQERRQRLLKAFDQWRRDYYKQLCADSIKLHELRLLAENTPPRDERIAWWYSEQISKMPSVDYKLDILAGGDPENVYALYEEATHG